MNRIERLAGAIVVLAQAGAVQAAGGHFDVDDASMLAPGHCQVEVWDVRVRRLDANLLHVGPGCRVGPVEASLNIERATVPDERADSIGPQLKWVTRLFDDRFSAGLVGSLAFDVHGGGGRTPATVYVPFTWIPSASWAVNANLGVDRDRTGGRSRRLGASVEWVPFNPMTLLGERVLISGAWTSRLGTRFMLGSTTSIDVSAGRTGPAAVRVGAIGLNHDFGR